MASYGLDPVWVATKTLELAIRAANTTSATASASATGSSGSSSRPPAYKAVGIILAISSGFFIGTSFVLKKVGLLKANAKYNEEAGEGYGYLKNAFWWTGMTLMIIGEICNFVAYAFVDAILVTPMGALSVVVTTILSAIFLKERLSFVGKMGCFICVVGAVIIPLNAPEQSAVSDIQGMQHYVIAPGFLSYAGVIIVGAAVTAFWVGPRYGKKSMLVYISICSWIGGLSVVATQGLGAAIVAQAGGEEQFKHWFLYVLFVFVICTLVTEIIYLNKALNLFNAALVTPTYYVYFTSTTIITSAVLFQGFAGSVTQIITIVLGFLTICSGVILLQMSKSAKDVPDTAVFTGDLDQMRTLAEQEQPESEPKADTVRGTAGLLRSISKSRRKMEAEEAKRIHEDKIRDQLEPIGEDEVIEWDGLRRRKTVLGSQSTRTSTVRRQKTVHPPLGMSHFPEGEDEDDRPPTSSAGGAFGFGFRRKSRRAGHGQVEETGSPMPQQDGSVQMGHVYGLPEGLKPVHSPTSSGRPIQWADEVHDPDSTRLASPQAASSRMLSPNPNPLTQPPNRRTFSFQNVLHPRRHEELNSPPGSKHGNRSFGAKTKDATEEERLGLVKGDSQLDMPEHMEKGEGSEESEDEPYLSNVAGSRSPLDDSHDQISMAGMRSPLTTDYDDYETTRRQFAPDHAGQHGIPPSSRHPLPMTPEVDEEDERDFFEAQRQRPSQGGEGGGRDGHDESFL